MFLAEKAITTNSAGVFRLYLIGDLHADRKAFQDERFKRWRAAIIKDEHAVAVFMGDAFEGRTPGQKHFNLGTLRKEYVLNMERYVDFCIQKGVSLLKPITDAGRPLFLIRGNHDSYQEWSGFSGALARQAGATYLDGAGLIRIRSGRGQGACYTTTIYATHGWGGGRTPGPKLNSLMSLRGVCDADIYCAAHVHDQMARVVPIPTVPAKGALRLETRDVAYLRAAAFLRQGVANEGGYDQDHAYPASDNGLVVLEVNPQHRRMRRVEAPF
ncbi:metallophosphoesterase [Humibacter sp.]|uniref:metallophosphoesterase n=1 Tax=Humibacter sp. TaxID=1940291 RepID=UPI003F7DA22A